MFCFHLIVKELCDALGVAVQEVPHRSGLNTLSEDHSGEPSPAHGPYEVDNSFGQAIKSRKSSQDRAVKGQPNGLNPIESVFGPQKGEINV